MMQHACVGSIQMPKQGKLDSYNMHISMLPIGRMPHTGCDQHVPNGD